MSKGIDMERQILEAIREWMESEHLTQRQAAERLRISQPNLNALLKGHRHYSLNGLLDAWEASGGHWELRLERT